MPLSQEAKKTVIMFVRLTDLDYQGKLEWYSKAEARQVCLEYKKSLMAPPSITYGYCPWERTIQSRQSGKWLRSFRNEGLLYLSR